MYTKWYKSNTVECHYNAPQYKIILHTPLQVECQLQSETTIDAPYLALTGELWGVFVNILKKLDRVIMAPHYKIHVFNLHIG